MILDRHRVLYLKYHWEDYLGQDKYVDASLEAKLARIPVYSEFGTLDKAGSIHYYRANCAVFGPEVC